MHTLSAPCNAERDPVARTRRAIYRPSPPQTATPAGWLWFVVVTVLVVLSAAALALSGPRAIPVRAPRAALPRTSREGFSSLPVGAQAPVSAALGGDQPSYRVRTRPRGLYAVNRAQNLVISFTRSGVAVRAGSSRLSLTLAAAGYGVSLRGVNAATPTAYANRVSYAHGMVSDWYVNGPLGLEQGFTLLRPLPESVRSRPTTLALQTSGDLHPVLFRRGQGLALETSTGRVRLRYDDLLATDARGRTLSAWLSVERGQIRMHVDTEHASFPVRIDPVFQTAVLSQSDPTQSDDDFGTSSAISGNTIVIGDPTHTGGHCSGVQCGAAYVFTKPASGWQNATQTAELTPSNGTNSDFFGLSVAIDGPTIVVGAPTVQDLCAPTSYSCAGAVYVYTEPASGWGDATETAMLGYDNYGSLVGFSVAISGSTIVSGNTGPPFTADVFSEPPSGWANAPTPTATLSLGNGGEKAQGSAVAISGSTIAAAVDGTTAYVFSEPAGGWQNESPTAEITPADGIDCCSGGSAPTPLAIDGSTLAIREGIGSSFGGGASTAPATVAVYREPSSGWQNAPQVATLTASKGPSSTDPELGDSVSIDGPTIVTGQSNGQSVSGGTVVQGSWVFTEPTSGWQSETEAAELVASPGAAAGVDVWSEPASGWATATGQTSPPANGGFPAPSPGGSARPVISGLKQSHPRWREGGRLATFAAKRKRQTPVGTTFSFRLNEAARVTLRFALALPGRKVGRTCVTQAKRNRHHAVCSREVIRGSLSFAGHAGLNTVSFQGRVSRSNKLPAGNYVMTANATSGGRVAPARALRFTIVR